MLNECSTKYGAHPEIESRRLKLSVFENPQFIEPKQTATNSLARQELIQEKKVEEVRTDLMINQAEDKQDKVETAKVLDGIAKVGVDTHTLVNAKFGALLRTNAAILRRMFESTGKEVDRLAAESAEKELSEHDARQAIVDANLLKG